MRRSTWLGPYRLLHRIASGGMAEIYRATLTTADGAKHDVAIKRLLAVYNCDEDFIAMLTDEARITARLEHENICRLYEFGVVEGQHILAMELVDGFDLRSVLRRCHERNEPLPVETAVYIVEQALRGLHCAHEQQDESGEPMRVVHRDFSPSNIIVGFDGAVKLIDFGIAKARLNRARTRGGVIKGKVKYMSPEQTLGKQLDRRSDVFAAGVVLYHAVTGTSPFHAPGDAELMVAIREVQPDPPSRQTRRADEALDAILEPALAKSPRDRYPTAEAFADALRGWLDAHEPDFSPGPVGRLLERMFARERLEQAQAQEEYAGPSSDELTPAGAAASYTRLVDVGRFTGTGEVLDPAAQVEAWLAARRNEEAPDLNKTQEVDAIDFTGELGVGELTLAGADGDTGRYERDDETTMPRLEPVTDRTEG